MDASIEHSGTHTHLQIRTGDCTRTNTNMQTNKAHIDKTDT